MVSATLLRRFSLPLVVAALVVLAGLSLDRVYSGQLLVRLVAGAALGVGRSSRPLLRRVPAWLVAPVSVVALLGVRRLRDQRRGPRRRGRRATCATPGRRTPPATRCPGCSPR